MERIIEEPLVTNPQFFLDTPNNIKRISLVTYKDGKFSGWIPNGIRVTEYTKSIN
ncbi:hypothetical protein [uncultured Prochlorococcus sp.]|uniref:hypothetical protein n=1 Tax=uncultured Prochlorococcus sp. TaxID=159733 RepID=UPI00258F2E76|nr:hypothetical protein [uncultured Prochlorococcus sp.]